MPKVKDKFFKRNRWEILIILIIFSFISFSLLSRTDKTPNTPETKKDTENSQSCKEEESIKKAKACTVIISSDAGHGTGFAIKPGFIVTNRHVIENSKKLSTWTDKEERLTLWGYSDDDDLAVLKTDAELPVCDWSSSSEEKVATTVYALGWPNFEGGSISITKGIYSRLIEAKEGPEFIQTDAAINPGNSGGPLIDKCGVIGVNFAKFSWSDPETPTEGFSFAMASNYIKGRVADLIDKGKPIKLPILSKEPERYTPEKPLTQCQDPQTITTWIKTRDDTREMVSYWNGVNTSEYDGGKLSELKNTLNQMNAIIERIVPKMVKCDPFSNDDVSQSYEWESLNRKAVNLEGQLDGQSYALGYYHSECRSNACLRVSGRGKNKCSTYLDCQPPQPKYHYTCQNNACARVSGEGTNDCTFDSDCSHYTCQDMACKLVPGKGTNDCYYDSQCYHFECRGRACAKVSGTGTSQCYWEGDTTSCVHSECQSGKCVEIDGPGARACYSDYGCQ